jgi:poly(3-hydroxybutyrate) depolymerase
MVHRFATTSAALAFALAATGVAPAEVAQEVTPVPAVAPLVPREWLVLPPIDARGRRPFSPNAAFAKHLLDPASAPPSAGEKLTGELGVEKEWTKRQADENGNVGGGPVQMAFTTVEWPVDGVPQVGDVYGDGMGGLPVPMKKGANAVYVTGMRGGFRLAFSKPDAALIVNPFDATLPDLVAGEVGEEDPEDCLGSDSIALLVINATNATLRDVECTYGSASPEGPFHRRTRRLEGGLGPRAFVKVSLPFTPRADHPIFSQPGTVSFPVEVHADDLTAQSAVQLEIKPPSALRRCTYWSSVDGSLQAYAVLPPTDETADRLVLTLHGAGVDCMGQAAAYSQKEDFWIVAPTNRRRFGFDWQDWGRRDAYDVLADALARTEVDPRRVYLTGHSMGGHGTWHLAANDPFTFAAIAPSAGWSSFDSHGGGRPKGTLAELWHAADGASRTLELVDNLNQVPTFVLHGTADDNVPVSEAQLMLDALTSAGGAPQHHFQEGAGHWWDGDASPGADCVDWPAIFELFRATERPDPIDTFTLTTLGSSVKLASREPEEWPIWVSIEQVEDGNEPARVTGALEKERHVARITTSNVRRLSVRSPVADHSIHWFIDGDDVQAWLPPEMEESLEAERPGPPEHSPWFERVDGRWKRAPTQEDVERRRLTEDDYYFAFREKSRDRCGPFKAAFDREFLLVWGTQGSRDESRELYERARYDAAQWWYRANGHAVVMSDVQWLQRSATYHERSYPDLGNENVILYGNRDSNAAWSVLLEGVEWSQHFASPIAVVHNSMHIGGREFDGDALGGVFVRPYPRGVGLVGVFADTGIAGTRLGYTLAYFISGVGYPDYAIYSSDILTKGDGGVLAAGWFAHDWSLPAAK